MNKKSYYSSLPQKRMAAGALLLNSEAELLLVKPTYKEGWEIPGGAVELNESPKQACLRELKEELGLDIRLERLLCVDWTKPEGDNTESLQFLFFGVLPEEAITKIVLPQEELSEFKFFHLTDALTHLEGRLRDRVAFCLKRLDDGHTHYLENQQQESERR